MGWRTGQGRRVKVQPGKTPLKFKEQRKIWTYLHFMKACDTVQTQLQSVQILKVSSFKEWRGGAWVLSLFLTCLVTILKKYLSKCKTAFMLDDWWCKGEKRRRDERRGQGGRGEEMWGGVQLYWAQIQQDRCGYIFVQQIITTLNQTLSTTFLTHTGTKTEDIKLYVVSESSRDFEFLPSWKMLWISIFLKVPF